MSSDKIACDHTSFSVINLQKLIPRPLPSQKFKIHTSCFGDYVICQGEKDYLKSAARGSTARQRYDPANDTQLSDN